LPAGPDSHFFRAAGLLRLARQAFAPPIFEHRRVIGS
jgi:hypothetical protein